MTISQGTEEKTGEGIDHKSSAACITVLFLFCHSSSHRRSRHGLANHQPLEMATPRGYIPILIQIEQHGYTRM